MMQKLFCRNFVLLILGQVTSLFGNFILRLALSMYVLDATGSAAVFAGILSAAMVPTIMLSPLGGILADRADRRTVMVVLDALTGASVLCAAVFLRAENDIAVICVLMIVLSVLGAFETPTVQACIPSMLEGDNIMRGNAVVNQAASLSYLTAPVLGGVCYAALGLRSVMLASTVCFFVTAGFECFIRLERHAPEDGGSVASVVRRDFAESMRYIFREQAVVSKMLFLTAVSRFFVMGITVVGLPFLVRNVLGLGAEYYGAAESALAVAAILGSIAAGVLTGRIRICRLSIMLGSLGIFAVPAGIAFIVPADPLARYIVNVISFCGMEIVISIFSIFAVSIIQQRTPNHLIGKVMAYTSTITLCAQPLGQIVYGFLFDRFSTAVHIVLIPTGLLICAVGALSANLFKSLEQQSSKS
ncbi:MAG: MFS transporter [Oscillibacter sp.]|nr:MFS transporter [Oscillibacter sp.]